GGSCGHMAKRYYDNSFIIADRTEVYVLETIGRRWAVERAGDLRAISNTYTIATDITAASPDLEAFARAQGWWAGNRPFAFAAGRVSDLRETGAVHWVTGTSAPCTSVFKPVFIDAGLPPQGARPGDRHDPATLWWRHEALHRTMVQGDYAGAMAWFRPERDAL